MKKKLLVGLIALATCFSLATFMGCKGNEKEKSSNSPNSESSIESDTSSETDNSSIETESDNETEIETKKTYTLKTVSSTDEYGKAGEYTICDNEKLQTGEKITLTATVNDGYNFVGWYIGNICVSDELEYIYTMKTENVVLEAVYNYYTVSTSCETDEYGTAGSYTEYSAEKVSIGEEVTVVASVNEGYNFEGWYLVDEWGNVLRCVSEDLSYAFTMEEKNIFLQAEYSYYTVTTHSSTDEYGVAGEYTKYNAQKVSVGEVVTLTAKPNKGYNFVGWYIQNTCVSTDLEYSFIMKEENVKYKAEYNYYTVSVYTDTNDYGKAGTCTEYEKEKISLGTTVRLTATVNKGYNFEGWYINSTCISENLEYSFVMEATNIKIKAVYSYYTLETEAMCYYVSTKGSFYPVMGSFDDYDEVKISAGTSITLKATVNAGYRFLGWYIRSVCVSEGLEYTFVMQKSKLEIEARFAPID